MTGRALILVVEDDEQLRDAVCDVLKSEGYDTSCAGNGEQALQILRSDGARPTLVLLDLMMPIMSGWEVLDAVALDPALSAIPFVVMSATRNQQGRLIRDRAFVAKPFRPEQLLKIIHDQVATAG